MILLDIDLAGRLNYQRHRVIRVRWRRVAVISGCKERRAQDYAGAEPRHDVNADATMPVVRTGPGGMACATCRMAAGAAAAERSGTTTAARGKRVGREHRSQQDRRAHHCSTQQKHGYSQQAISRPMTCVLKTIGRRNDSACYTFGSPRVFNLWRFRPGRQDDLTDLPSRATLARATTNFDNLIINFFEQYIAELPQTSGLYAGSDDLPQQQLTRNVCVGLGLTSPQEQIKRVMCWFGVGKINSSNAYARRQDRADHGIRQARPMCSSELGSRWNREIAEPRCDVHR